MRSLRGKEVLQRAHAVVVGRTRRRLAVTQFAEINRITAGAPFIGTPEQRDAGQTHRRRGSLGARWQRRCKARAAPDTAHLPAGAGPLAREGPSRNPETRRARPLITPATAVSGPAQVARSGSGRTRRLQRSPAPRARNEESRRRGKSQPKSTSPCE